uniref:Uncharacterized protein n=1 Tax=Anguilla anguilla TaxID=7936 RepID=A0A0E9VU28_ANGAN
MANSTSWVDTSKPGCLKEDIRV